MRRFVGLKAALLSSAMLALSAGTALAQNSGQVVFSNITITGSGQVPGINGANTYTHVFNDRPASVPLVVNNYPASITLGESNVQPSGGLERDVWRFAHNGSDVQFGEGDFFNASMTLDMTGGVPGYDIEAGYLFSNPSGAFGGDCQFIVQGSGGVVQFGGPSYYPFSPAAGGYPGAGAQTANYVEGTPITLGFVYTTDPNTGNDAFEYSVNGQYAASAPGDPYFDVNGTLGVAGSSSNTLGGYFQIEGVPEPTSFGLVSIGAVGLLRRRRAAKA